MVRTEGPVEAARLVRAGRVGERVSEATAGRAATVDPLADLEAAQRHGIRLVVPESSEWPHFAFAALEAAGLRRLERYRNGEQKPSPSGELIPPLALWVRGVVDLATVGIRSVAIVGARAATPYGERVAKDLAYQLTDREFVVVSGGAHGIDTAAHRGALAAGGPTVLISAGGLDCPYPPANAGLFERVAEQGLLVSESPPGAAPQRRRFLTRNRLIAALGTGTVVVEAAGRSGAMNTAGHCTGLGRPRMAVPGPISSAMSVGCHRLIAAEHDPARLVTGVADVLATIGSSSDLSRVAAGRSPAADSVSPADDGAGLTARLDGLDGSARQVFDGLPSHGWIATDRLVLTTGLPLPTVIGALPMLELAGLVEAGTDGYRIRPELRPGRSGRAS
jgi:DNA processing protein